MAVLHHNTFLNLSDNLAKLILKNSNDVKLAKSLHVEEQKQPL